MRTLILTAAAASLASIPAVTAPAAASTAAAALAPAPAQRGYHVDKRYGFKFKQPRKYENIAIKVEEQWLAAKYVSEQEYSYYDKDTGGTYLHAPEVLVIAFPLEAMEGGTDVEEDKDGDKITITINNPYKDYDDFLKRTFEGGGYYEAKDPEEEEIDGVKVTKLLYKVEKLARSGPQTISTWIYHSEDVDYAVQVVGLTKHWDKVEKAIKPIRQSFELIEREGPIKIDTATEITISRMDLDVADKKEARSVAVKSEKVMHERAIAKLPPEGWDHKKKGRVLTLFSADKKYADRVQRHTNSLLDWLDENFGFLGDDAYLRKPIVRICKDIDEAAAYSAGVNSGGYGGSWDIEDELVTWWDSAGWTGGAIDRLNSQIYRYWMLEKNFRLSTALPEWINFGLRNLVENARLDSRRPDWRYDIGLITYAKQLAREGNALRVEEIFKMTSKEFQERSQGAGNPLADGALLINYLASPEIKRHRLAEDMLQNYLRNMIKVVEEVEKAEKRKLDAARRAAKKGDGDREYVARRRQIFEEMEKELLDKTFELTFGEFDEDDWDDINEHFRDAY